MDNMYAQARDDHQSRAYYGDIDKGPTIEEPAALTSVVDAAVDLVRRYKDRRDILSDVIKMIEKYLADQTMDQCEDDEEFETDLFEPIRNLIVRTEHYFNSVLHNDTEIHDRIYKILNQFSCKVRAVIGGCAVAVVEFTSFWMLLQPYPSPFPALYFICNEVREMLLRKVLTKEKIEVALAELKDPLSDEASLQVLEILREVKEKFLRVQVTFQSKSLLSCQRGESSTLELTFMAAFPSKAKDEKKKLELMKKFMKQFEDFPNEYHRLYHTILVSFWKKELAQSEGSKISEENLMTMMKEIPNPNTIYKRHLPRLLKGTEFEFQKGSKVHKPEGEEELEGETEEEALVELFKDTELGEGKEKENKGAEKFLSEEEEQMRESSGQE